jgi:hypothetical protein
MCESFVSFGHLVGVIAFFHELPRSFAASSNSPARRSIMVVSPRLRAASMIQRMLREQSAVMTNFNRNLIGRTTNTAGANFKCGRNFFQNASWKIRRPLELCSGICLRAGIAFIIGNVF